eukprot:TRINITY_DN65014_c0_g1_i1.p1 TRINITY_DN65014_c0_g1~~TRINITY_DN65014_c0_g1_i1.p1  ORF type:complete len:312 (+),score=32.26 TRINITY_DN65014_c0_g1_i1:102-938(+)
MAAKAPMVHMQSMPNMHLMSVGRNASPPVLNQMPRVQPMLKTPPAHVPPPAYYATQQPLVPCSRGTSVAEAPPTLQVYAAPANYKPQSVREAWDNHYDAFSKRDVSRIVMDYDETSHVRVFNNADGAKSEYSGTVRVHQLFSEMFSDLSDLSTLDIPVVDIDEDAGQVLIVWKCPSSGYLAATETLIFSRTFKIWKQNIVITKVPSCAAALLNTATPPAAAALVEFSQVAGCGSNAAGQATIATSTAGAGARFTAPPSAFAAGSSPPAAPGAVRCGWY